MEAKARKITSNKFIITLPKDWRDSLGLTPEDTVLPYFESGSVLVIVPSSMTLTPIEVQLIDLLTSLRSITHIKELLGELYEKLPAPWQQSVSLEQLLDTVNQAMRLE